MYLKYLIIKQITNIQFYRIIFTYSRLNNILSIIINNDYKKILNQNESLKEADLS